MGKLGRLLASIGAIALVAILLSCDGAVYHPDEILAQKKFQSIVAGITEEDLKKQLGEPMGRIVFEQARGTYQYFTSSNPTPVAEFRTLDAIDDSRLSELRLLPTGKRGNKILVFLDGTVNGYFYFWQTGRLEDKAIVVS